MLILAQTILLAQPPFDPACELCYFSVGRNARTPIAVLIRTIPKGKHDSTVYRTLQLLCISLCLSLGIVWTRMSIGFSAFASASWPGLGGKVADGLG